MMILKAPADIRVLIIRPGATDFDDQQRMKGSLDMPLSNKGMDQAESTACELADVKIKALFVAPDQSARQTAERLVLGRDIKIKVIDAFRNIDHGLWSGKLIEEVKRNHPRVYRTGIDSPDELVPPEGERIGDARERTAKSLKKCLKKSRDGVVAFVVPDPLAAVLESMIRGSELHDIWSSQIDDGRWNLVETTQA